MEEYPTFQGQKTWLMEVVSLALDLAFDPEWPRDLGTILKLSVPQLLHLSCLGNNLALASWYGRVKKEALSEAVLLQKVRKGSGWGVGEGSVEC